MRIDNSNIHARSPTTGAPTGSTRAAAIHPSATFAAILEQKTESTHPASAEAAPPAAHTERYDFRNMTCGEVEAIGNQLFKEGKITIEELFRFSNPSGSVKIVGNSIVRPGPDTPVNFIENIQTAIRNMEETGEAKMPKSSYPIYQSLLAKLKQWQQ